MSALVRRKERYSKIRQGRLVEKESEARRMGNAVMDIENKGRNRRRGEKRLQDLGITCTDSRGEMRPGRKKIVGRGTTCRKSMGGWNS